MDPLTKLLIITGSTGVGKSTFCQIVSNNSEFQNINTGYCLRIIMEKAGFDVGHKFNLGRAFLNTYGEVKIFEAINNWIIPGNSYILDGIRLFSTFKSFKAHYKNTKTIFVETTEELRIERYYQWLIQDGLDADHASKIANRKEEYYEDLMKIKSESDFKVLNTGTVSDFKLQALHFGQKIDSLFI